MKEEIAFSVKQHNAITEARYEMTSLQKNIVYMLLSQLKDNNKVRTKYKIPFQNLKKIKNTRINKQEVRQAARGLISSVLTLYDEFQKKFLTISILSSADYGEGADRDNLIVEFDSELYPFLFDIKDRFTTFILHNALKLKSKYSKRIYEMLCQFKSTGIFRISVQELKERFGLVNLQNGEENSYKDFSLFAAKILEVAKKEINNSTDISFNYVTKKTGRKVTHLEFRINSKENNEDNKELVASVAEDAHLEELEKRLVSKFRLSKTLAKKVIDNISYGEINKILYDIQIEESNKKVRKLGAYATAIFQNMLDGAPVTAKDTRALKYIPLKHDGKISADKFDNQEKEFQTRKNSDSSSSSHIGEYITQIMASNLPVQTKKVISEEEKKSKAEKEAVWRMLYRDLKINYLEVDDLMKIYPLEKLKDAISKVFKNLEEQEEPQESSHIITMLKKELELV